MLKPRFDIPRAEVSRFWTLASPVLALLITVIIGVILFAALGKDPVRGLQVFFWEPIKSSYALGELMVKATPLLIIALGWRCAFAPTCGTLAPKASLSWALSLRAAWR